MVKFGERVDRRTLTINERVLLHIYERSGGKGTLDAPSPLTQQGIARALRMRVNHVSRAVKVLEEQRCITEATARVRGEVRKRKVYVISHEGHATAQALVNDLSRRVLRVRDESGVSREMTLSDARRLPGGPHAYTDLLSGLDDGDVLDAARLAPGKGSSASVHHDEDRPRGEPFYGRARELAIVADWLSSSIPVLVVQGPRGMGKSALASRALETLAGDRHTVWIPVREGDGIDGFARAAGAFLGAVGRGDLATRLLDHAAKAPEVGSIFERDWPAPAAILVLDDADRAPPEVARIVAEAMRGRGGKALLTCERPLPDQAALRASGVLQVLPLGGLEKPDCRRLAPKSMPTEEFDKVYRLARGNPMSVKVLATEALEGIDADFSAEERALLRVLKLRQDSD